MWRAIKQPYILGSQSCTSNAGDNSDAIAEQDMDHSIILRSIRWSIYSRPFTGLASASLGSAGGSFGRGRFSSLATSFAAQKPVTKASASPPAYPKLLNPPASTPATWRPGIRLLSAVKAWPSLSIFIPPYVNVILGYRQYWGRNIPELLSLRWLNFYCVEWAFAFD